MQSLYGSICVSDIPKNLIFTAQNGKRYLRIRVCEKQSPDKYENTHYIKCYVPKDEVKEGVNYYIGNLKPSNPPLTQTQGANIQPAEQTSEPVKQPDNVYNEDDDLPF